VEQARRRMRVRRSVRLTISHTILIAGSVLMLFPLVWLIVSSFKPSKEIFAPGFTLHVENLSFQNYLKGWNTNPQFPFGHFMINTLLLVFETLICTLVSCTITAFAFSKLKFPGRSLFFALMMLTMMIPGQVTMIPTYIMFTKFNWLNTHLPFIVPAITATSAFDVFLLMQFMRTIPQELSDAAYIDGCSNLKLYWRIIIPLSRNAIFSVIIFSIMGTWNEFLKPLIYLTTVRKWTISLVLKSIVDVTEPQAWGNLMAMSVVSLAPCIIIFFMAQKYFIQGIATTGMKG